jgi:hypothetical protein
MPSGMAMRAGIGGGQAGSLAKRHGGPFDKWQRLVAACSRRLQDMGEGLTSRGREGALGIEVHRGLDLDARRARGIGARVNLREVALEIRFDGAASRSGIFPGECAILGVSREPGDQNVLWQGCQLGLALGDGYVRRIALARKQQRAFVLLLENLLKPALR